MSRLLLALCAGCVLLSSSARAEHELTCVPEMVPGLSASTYSLVFAINDRGDSVGYSKTDTGSPPFEVATLYRDGELRVLPTYADSLYMRALDINEAGRIVGTATAVDYIDTPVYWERGEVHALNKAGAISGTAVAINERGQIVGTVSFADRQRCALWSRPDAAPVLIADLGGTACMPAAINDAGVVVGSATNAEESFHAFVLARGTLRDLGPAHTLTTAKDLNNAGEIVGAIAYDPAVTASYPILWTRQLEPRIYEAQGAALSINDRRDVILRTAVEGADDLAIFLVDRRGRFRALPSVQSSDEVELNNRRTLIWNGPHPTLGISGYTCSLN